VRASKLTATLKAALQRGASQPIQEVQVCGYGFKTALKMLRMLKEIQREIVQGKQG